MKRILLLSDTHGHIDERILHYATEADEVWHAGDIGTLAVTDALEAVKPVRAVFGNIDGAKIRQVFGEDAVFESQGVKVWITHIGGYPGRYAKGIPTRLKEIKPDLFICGHSHILKVGYDKTHALLHMNPGAAGKQGFHQQRTMLRFTLSDGKVKDLEVIELGKRSRD